MSTEEVSFLFSNNPGFNKLTVVITIDRLDIPAVHADDLHNVVVYGELHRTVGRTGVYESHSVSFSLRRKYI